MGVENGVFQENKTASLAAIFRLRALRGSPLAISIGGRSVFGHVSILIKFWSM